MARDHAQPLMDGIQAVDNVVYGADDIVRRWVAKHIGQDFLLTPDQRAVGIVRNGKIGAGVVFEKYCGQTITTSVAVTDPKCFNRTTLRRWFEFPFKQLKVERITSVVAESNLKALKFNGQIGMRFEARLPRAAYDGSDLIILRMFREECPWLGGDDGEKR